MMSTFQWKKHASQFGTHLTSRRLGAHLIIGLVLIYAFRYLAVTGPGIDAQIEGRPAEDVTQFDDYQPNEFADHLPNEVLYAPSKSRWFRDHDFTPEIAVARGKLANNVAGYTLVTKAFDVVRHKKHKTVYRQVLGTFNVLLAVKNTGDKIDIVKIARYQKIQNGFVIDWNKVNGVNTNFIVKKPVGYTVLAIRRVIELAGTYQEVIYTPFTADIDTPTMRKLGAAYLQNVVERAYSALLNEGVASRSFPDQRVAAVVPVKTALAVSFNEHIDPDRLSKESVDNLVDEDLVIIAANRDEAYDYAISRTGARGLFQFMPRTYASIVKQYPGAHLNPDFASGMDDHVNAAKAALLLFDSDLGQLPHGRRIWIVAKNTDPHYAAVYLAAAYNHGGKRVAEDIALGGAWTHRLPPETRLYIVKLDKVRSALRL